MLATIGLRSEEELIAHLPADVRFDKRLNVGILRKADKLVRFHMNEIHHRIAQNLKLTAKR